MSPGGLFLATKWFVCSDLPFFSAFCSPDIRKCKTMKSQWILKQSGIENELTCILSSSAFCLGLLHISKSKFSCKQTKKNWLKLLSIGYCCLNEWECLDYIHNVVFQILLKKGKERIWKPLFDCSLGLNCSMTTCLKLVQQQPIVVHPQIRQGAISQWQLVLWSSIHDE